MRRLLCLLLCLLLLPLAAPAEDAAPTVRILLRRLELADRADLWLDGAYTAHLAGTTMAFPRDSQVTVQIRSGQLYLFYEGMSLAAGQAVTFVRNQAGEELTGLRFEEKGNLYPGTLQLTIADGVLKPIMSLSVEEYLMGVVPYEMSNSFPLEALKAQAICARTYALAHMNAKAEYDMVDTTNDQVFKGVDLTNTVAIRAVQETAGVVGAYNGKLATCYYAASNGGQTALVEHAWSGRGGQLGYYAMTDDPYDVENPESVVRRAKLSRENPVLPEAFLNQLIAAMGEDMLQEGFSPEAGCLRVDGIQDVKVHTPRFGQGNKVMTKLTLTLTWSGRKNLGLPATPVPWMATELPAGGDEDSEVLLFVTPAPTEAYLFAEPTVTPVPTPAPTPVYSEFIAAQKPATVTLDMFPGAVSALGISVYGADNEIVTVVETNEAFTLEARRYGHGVGMSQRGAQWMAGRYGKTYAEILAFYYPGMTLMKAPAGAALLPTVQPELAVTISPPATPTPRPTLMPVTEELPAGAYLASVENIDDNSSLNLRAEPSTASQILRRLYKHQQLIVLEECTEEGWVKVKTDVIEGYVMLSFLERME